MDGALTFIHICVDNSRTVLEHHKSFTPFIFVQPNCTRATQFHLHLDEKKKRPGQLQGSSSPVSPALAAVCVEVHVSKEIGLWSRHQLWTSATYVTACKVVEDNAHCMLCTMYSWISVVNKNVFLCILLWWLMSRIDDPTMFYLTNGWAGF